VTRLLARIFATTSALLALLVTLIGGALAPGHSHITAFLAWRRMQT
jgi:hypothetical protein